MVEGEIIVAHNNIGRQGITLTTTSSRLFRSPSRGGGVGGVGRFNQKTQATVELKGTHLQLERTRATVELGETTL